MLTARVCVIGRRRLSQPLKYCKQCLTVSGCRWLCSLIVLLSPSFCGCVCVSVGIFQCVYLFSVQRSTSHLRVRVCSIH